MALDIVPITLAEANEFVRQKHRHHGKDEKNVIRKSGRRLFQALQKLWQNNMGSLFLIRRFILHKKKVLNQRALKKIISYI